ncbi:BnaA07g37040D [Brassica napus]|uniref:BnaA07g37040D protein n=1 Tax=Brassica napus TaxID=3708 RepID=A0A078IMA4_BRANA|nr:BnaA07g37040D [Brassica napus]
MVVDQDQQWLLGCLTASLDPNQNVRSFAETSLNQASLQPGFGSALCRVAANKDLSLGLPAVLLKQFIKKHWRENEEDFEYPLVSNEEKALIRGLLLGSLDDSHRKICTAISMDISSIATYDWPEEWPELLPFLLKLISDQNNINGVHGALRCLALLSGDLDDKDVPALVPVLFPCLQAVVSSPQSYDKYMRGKALSIFYSCISVLGAMSGVYKTETTTLVTPLLEVWMNQFSLILEHPVQPDDPDDWSLRMEVLKCLNQFVQNFPFLMESELIAIMRPLWHTFESSLQVYLRSSVEGAEDSYDGRYDSDGEEKSLDTFIIQLFEFLSTIVSSRRLAKVLASNVRELVYQTVAFLQVTEQQVHTWSTDVNQFVADEDEGSFSCRISGILLLEEVVNTFGREGINAVVDAAGKRFHESQNEKIAGSSSWWRIREAALYALASLADQLVDAEDLGTDHANLAKFIEQLIMEDTGTGYHECPFLYARIFTAVAKFSSEINPGILEHFLNAAVRAINMDVPPPVKVGACRALLQLLPDMNRSVILPQIMNLFSSLTDLLHQASDETLILVLETLQQAIKAGHEASASIESIISPVILNVWVAHVSDPFISIDIIDVLEVNSHKEFTWLSASTDIKDFTIHRTSFKEGTHLFFLSSVYYFLFFSFFLNDIYVGAPSDVVKTAYEFCFDAVIRIILHSEDNSELQNATECLAAFISSGRQELLSWSGDPSLTMRSLLDAASRLLNPDLECSGSLFAGKYILQLILHLPSEMAPHVQDLVAALVRRMQSAEISGFRSSLLLIFARLVHMSFPNVDQFINLLVSVPADGHENSFAYVMTEWTKQQGKHLSLLRYLHLCSGEIQGAYQIKVTCSALALLLSTRHSEFAKVNVPGNRIQSNGGITTRSKAKSAPEQWTIIPLPMKVLELLADTLIEIQEQVLGCEDEDSEWEEVDDVNVEGEKDLLRSTGASQSSKPSYDQLEAMARTFENQDDGDGDDDFHVTDPLNEINLASYLADFMLKFSSGDRPLFDNLCQGLTNAQRNVIQTVLNR